MSSEKRQKIFQAYSDNLMMLIEHGLIPDVRKNEKRPYICPICFAEFTEADLDITKKQHLTLEDAPPKSLGGKANVLTCKKCNNTCGAEIDLHLANRIKELDQTKFFRNSEARTKAEKDELVVNGTIKVDADGTMTMSHSTENNNPAVLEEYMKRIKAGTIITIYFMPLKVDDNRLKIALLKTAYLLMFEKYGYALLFDKEYDRLRAQLLNPAQTIYAMDFWFLGPFPEELIKVVPFVKENNLGSIMPFFLLKTNQSRYVFSAILPVNSRPIEEIITGFRSRFDETSAFSVEMHRFNEDMDFLNNPEHAKQLINFVRTLQ